jgi:hypothetical protein
LISVDTRLIDLISFAKGRTGTTDDDGGDSGKTLFSLPLFLSPSISFLWCVIQVGG